MEHQYQVTSPELKSTSLPNDDYLELKILFSSDEPAKLGKTFKFKPTNASKSTIVITSPDCLIINSVLDISITSSNTNHVFLVTGDVTRCKKDKATASFDIFIQLKDRVSANTDLVEWKKFISRK